MWKNKSIKSDVSIYFYTRKYDNSKKYLATKYF